MSKMDNVHLVDFTELGEFYNISQVFDLRKDQAGHLPFSDKYYAAKGTSLARKVHSWQKQHFKVIVLDCDNTLWQGVCGEDGTLGVKIEGPYLELQKFMLQKHDDGMLLVLCSKNNEPDVWDVFDRNPEMVLKRDYISNWKINWQPKSENIKALAKELNLGIDSFIFIDDNPLECSEVMTNCPEVLTLLLPKDKKQIAVFLQHVWAFDRFKVTDEDKKRTKMYIAERKRQEVQQSGMNLENFLAGLELKMSMNYMEKANLARVSQLTQRTNQFNLSTTRRTEEEIEKLLQNEDTECWTIQVSDCFGDYGVVGVVITHKGTEELFIDTFLLSCRVLGRRVEDAILIGLKKYCQEYNLNQIEARFYPTAKNTPFKEFLERTAWEKEEETAEYIKYNLITEKLSDSSECIELYINSDYSKKLIDEANNHVSAVSKLGESIPTNMYQPEEMNLVFSEKNWQIQIVNEENLLHRKQLLPLENYSGELLAKLPVISINEQKLKRAEYVGPRDETEEKLVQIYDY
ncbi:MAG: HAD-IIIC family phosphatase [Halanaerobiales bacterium]|nr:HAD-IIIC family phosphatase [Halanaerobiales bacterium]